MLSAGAVFHVGTTTAGSTAAQSLACFRPGTHVAISDVESVLELSCRIPEDRLSSF
jgi:hypothetical protein